ncbi:hypothetical protein [Notoacmeibacter sp. MSK16QG-6]|uniref:hypothetical protein n=1 Tax=Notoacmeibacter sp. MSK16QG-6 TaxID=2957982 RepID=UPI00209EDE32|nr:hypothetical protein [Notoacmeibacter sp. MSK16QG-6]MCP1197882.1 hypothetical protein [Notoacmeibacter sp. MSK16QG-6]
MARLVPVSVCLFWMAVFVATGLMAMLAHRSAGEAAIWPALILPIIAGATALGFAWLAAMIAVLPRNECPASDRPSYQLVFTLALVTIGVSMIGHVPAYGLRSLIDGSLVASGLIASFLLIEKAMPEGFEEPPARLSARRSSHLAALAAVVRPCRADGDRS